jgi:hypothetical protein
MRWRVITVGVAILALLSCTAVATRARADGPQDPAAAQSLFDAGRDLMEQSKYAEACAKFEASNKLDPSAGTLLNLGRCYERLGKTASAWAAYNQAITLGRATSKPRQVAAAEELVASLEPRLSRLVVRIASAPPGLRAMKDEVAMDPAALGVPLAVDPGEHGIDVEAPGFEPFHGRVVVEDGGKTVTFDVPPLVPEKKLEPPPPPPPPPAHVEPREAPLGPMFIAGAVTGGVGIVGLAVGAAFGAIVLADADEAASDPSLCPDYRCTPKGLAFVDSAETKAAVSTGLLAAGGVATATGVVLVLLDWPASAPVRPTALALPSGVGVAIGGAL